MNRSFRRTVVAVLATVVVCGCVAFGRARAAQSAHARAPRQPTLQDVFDRAYRGVESSHSTTSAPRRTSFRERWRVAFPMPFVGLPAADAKGVVVTAGESEVAAVSSDGRVEWTSAVAGALVNAPRLDADRVFVAATRAVVALDRATGAVVWSVPTVADGADHNRANEPVVIGDVVVATTEAGVAYGIGRADGAVRWVVDLPTATTAEPAAIAGVVVVVGIGQWWGLDPQTGATVWSGDIGTYGTSSPVVYPDAERDVAALATDGRVMAVDAHTGEAIWQHEADQSEYFQVPTISTDHELLVPNHWGRLAAFDAHDGTLKWKVRGADAVAEFGEPAVLGPRLVALSLDADGPRIGAPTGSQRLKTPAAGHGVAATPAGELIVTTWDAPVNYVVAYAVDVGSSG